MIREICAIVINTDYDDDIVYDMSSNPLELCFDKKTCGYIKEQLCQKGGVIDVIHYIKEYCKNKLIYFGENVAMLDDEKWYIGIDNVATNVSAKLSLILNNIFVDMKLSTYLNHTLIKINDIKTIAHFIELFRTKHENVDIKVDYELFGFANGVYNVNTQTFSKHSIDNFVGKYVDYNWVEPSQNDIKHISGILSTILDISLWLKLISLSIFNENFNKNIGVSVYDSGGILSFINLIQEPLSIFCKADKLSTLEGKKYVINYTERIVIIDVKTKRKLKHDPTCFNKNTTFIYRLYEDFGLYYLPFEHIHMFDDAVPSNEYCIHDTITNDILNWKCAMFKIIADSYVSFDSIKTQLDIWENPFDEFFNMNLVQTNCESDFEKIDNLYEMAKNFFDTSRHYAITKKELRSYISNNHKKYTIFNDKLIGWKINFDIDLP